MFPNALAHVVDITYHEGDKDDNLDNIITKFNEAALAIKVVPFSPKPSTLPPPISW